MILKRISPLYLLFTLGCFFIINSPVFSQHSEIKNGLDSLLAKEYREGNLNGSVLVIQENKIIFENSYGFTDGSKNKTLTRNHRFNLGSVFKEFPGVAIMQLEEGGRLNLNDLVSKHLKELPEWSKKITIKNLLQYTSGLPNVPWNTLFKDNTVVEENDLLNELDSLETLEFAPGTNYLYSTYNPILLIKIVEAISGYRFSEYAEKHLLAPAKMESTIFKREYPYRGRTNMAIPFNSDFKEDQYRIAIDFVLLCSTPGDIYNWFHDLENYRIISKKSLKKLSEEFPDLPEINTQSPLGHLYWKSGSIQSHIHHGNSNNYECIVKSFPQEQLTIVILTNREAGDIYGLSDIIYETVMSNKKG